MANQSLSKLAIDIRFSNPIPIPFLGTIDEMKLFGQVNSLVLVAATAHMQSSPTHRLNGLVIVHLFLIPVYDG